MRVFVILLLLLLPNLPSTLRAGTSADRLAAPDSTVRHVEGDAGGRVIPSVTWRGRPYPGTKSFVITEFGMMYRLDPYPYGRFTDHFVISFDVGWMRNISANDAVGFSGYALPSDQTTRLGLRARYRRWLSQRLSVDVSPGVILGGEDGGVNYKPPGFVLGTTLNAADLVSVMVDAEYARGWDFVEQDPPFLHRQTHTDVTWRAGAKLGSGLGLAAFAVVAGLVVLVITSGAAD